MSKLQTVVADIDATIVSNAKGQITGPRLADALVRFAGNALGGAPAGTVRGSIDGGDLVDIPIASLGGGGGSALPVPAGTLKANLTGSTAIPQDVLLSTLAGTGNPLGDAIAAKASAAALTALTSVVGTKIGDAPNDGTSYVRKNFGWASLPASTGGIAEAPTDGQSYLRKSSSWSPLSLGKADVGLGNVDNTSDATKAASGNPIGNALAVRLAKSANLSDLADAAAARGNLGLGSAAINYIGRRFDIADYGAPLNGDCAAALRAAIDALNASPTGGTIVVNGAYSCLSTVDKTISTGHHFAMEGTTTGSAIYFSGISGTGLAIRAGAFDVRLSVKNMSFYVDQSPNLTDLVVLRGGGDHGCIVVDNVNMAGSTAAVPNNFLVLVNPLDCVFREINIDGRSGPYGPSDNRGAGIYAFGDKQNGASVCTGIVFDACTVNRVGTGVNVVGTASSGSTTHTIEGLHFRNCTISGIGTAVTYNSPGDLIPGMGFYGGHINACKYAFGFSRIAQFKISDVLMYMDVNYQPQAFIITSGICYDLSIHNNTFYMVDTQGSGLTPGINAIILQNQAQACLITDNLFDMKTADPVIRIDAGARANAYGFNKRVVNGGNASATLVDITVSDNGTGTINLSAGAATVAGLTDATAGFKALNVADPLGPYVKRNLGVVMAGEYAKFDGTTNDSAAWQTIQNLAAANPSYVVEMPAGTTIINPGIINIPAGLAYRMEGKGKNCTILKTAGGSSPIITAAGSGRTKPGSLNGFSIQSNGALSTYALDLEWGSGNEQTSFNMQEVDVQAVNGAFGGGLYFKNCGNFNVQFHYRGIPQTKNTAGMMIAGQCYGGYVDLNTIFSQYGLAIETNSNAEEINLISQVVYADWGVYGFPFTRTDVAVPRGFRFKGGHMETFLGGILLNKRYESEIQSGLIWKREDSASDWIGVQLLSCVNSNVNGNRMWGRVNYCAGGNSTGVFLDNSNGTHVINNRLAGNTYCVDPRNNTAARIANNTYDAKTTTAFPNTAGGSSYGDNPQLNVNEY